MRLTIDDDWLATVTDEPLALAPRFEGNWVDLAPRADTMERERFFGATFGSREWLWDAPDTLRFDRDTRRLVGARLQMPYLSADTETTRRVPVLPATRPGGLLADEVRDFRMEMCAVLCRAAGDTELICLRDPDVLDAPLEARIGIAPDVGLLVQRGTVVGWSITDPVRHLTTGAPDPTPPAAGTRRLFSACLDLVTQPLFDAVDDGDPAALARLRATDEALRDRTEDRARAEALLDLISTMVEDHGGPAAAAG
ncbi:hypothetical protein AB6O49_30685 [Streptomyces sp. SBR177]